MNTSSDILTLHGIEAGFNESGRKTTLLYDVNLAAKKGEVVSVIGANGSGKSTLLRIIASIIKPLAGNVELASRRVSDYTGSELAGLVAFVAAGSSVPLSMRVDELVSLGRFPHTNWMGRLKNDDMIMIEESLNSVGMLKLRERPLYKLSDGEKQRAVIARALAQDPVLILLDEPTAFLDLPNRYDLIYLLRKLAEERGKCVVLTTHDMEIAARESDKLWLIHNNRVNEGAPEDMIINGILSSLFGERNISYSESDGVFKRGRVTGSLVKLEGERRLVKLTARALERLGIKSTAGNCPDSISALNSAEGPRWTYTGKRGFYDFSTIYGLTTFLKEHHVDNGA
ncbi:MAG: ABC transporter ATP-binding protein [Bacteroidales bacterium]|nr:ABC transporter ATP-binding protein [Bacteroidales bacterium]